MNQRELVVIKQLVGIVQSLALKQGISNDDEIITDLFRVERQIDSLIFSARHPMAAEWNANSIKLDCGIVVAPSDFYLISEKGETQEFFSHKEARELIKPILKDTVWRIPNCKDIELIIDELQDKIWETLHLRDGGLVFYRNWQNRDGGVTVGGSGPHYLIEPNDDERRINVYGEKLAVLDRESFDDEKPIIDWRFVHACAFRVRCVSGQAR